MIVVTGGAGFIGSNLVKALNARGREDVLVVDDLRNGRKLLNLADCEILDLVDRDEFRQRLAGKVFADAEAVFHQGACAVTTEWDGRTMMEANYRFSRDLLDSCLARGVQVIYASSASVYGSGAEFAERPENEKPLNLYAYSKLLFDRYVRRVLPKASSQIVGLRYFNVYGPREQHKGKMASMAHQLHLQLQGSDRVRLFRGNDGYGDGEHRRDFVWVGDVVDVNLWFWAHPDRSGIFNVGSGRSQTFNDVARAVIAWHGRGEIEYVPFPDELVGAYQSFTQADLGALRAAGYEAPFHTVEQAVPLYLDWLAGKSGAQR